MDDNTSPAATPALLTYAQAAPRLGMSQGVLRSLVHRRQVPHVRIAARTVRFDPRDLDRWLAERCVRVGG